MKSHRILIVGGVAGGASAATRARRMNESAEIIMFEKGDHVSFANCGLPYYIGGQIAERDHLLLSSAEEFRGKFNIDVRTRCEVMRIDRSAKRVEVLNHRSQERKWEGYDKLILAPGASPIVPSWQGVTAPNVFTLRDLADMDRIKMYIDTNSPRQAIIIGAGFIGLEMVEALVSRGLHVSVVELAPQVLPPLDPEMAGEIESVLRGKGVDVHIGMSVENLAVIGDRVAGVRLPDGSVLPADLVLLSMGVRPNTQLASEAGLKIGTSGAIAVNEHLQTSDPDIYAVGDAAEVIHAVTKQPTRIPLAGPANRNGRLAGEHAATGLGLPATPVASTAIVGVFEAVAAMTGLSEKAARKVGLDVDVAYCIRGHHAGYYPGASEMILKLIYERGTHRVLGAQGFGSPGVDKRIDTVATAIHFGGTLNDLAGLDLAYAPQFGSAKDPLHIAAFVALNQANADVRQIASTEPVPAGQLVDVRTLEEFKAGALAGAVSIPLVELRARLSELDAAAPVVVYCQVGQRGYYAARILMQSGFPSVYNLAGGYRLAQRRQRDWFQNRLLQTQEVVLTRA